MSQVYVQMCVVFVVDRVTGGELFDEIVAREFYSEHDARCVVPNDMLCHGCSSQAEYLHVNACQVGVVCVEFVTTSRLWWDSPHFHIKD